MGLFYFTRSSGRCFFLEKVQYLILVMTEVIGFAHFPAFLYDQDKTCQTNWIAIFCADGKRGPLNHKVSHDYILEFFSSRSINESRADQNCTNINKTQLLRLMQALCITVNRETEDLLELRRGWKPALPNRCCIERRNMLLKCKHIFREHAIHSKWAYHWPFWYPICRNKSTTVSGVFYWRLCILWFSLPTRVYKLAWLLYYRADDRIKAWNFSFAENE